MIHRESLLQKGCVRWFRLKYPDLLLFAIPNGGCRSGLEAAIMKGEGVLAGMPDLCLAVACKGYNGLFIEMKSGKNKPTKRQQNIIEKLRSKGYKCEICYSFDQFKNIIDNYIK
jgi:hypothetical protein